MNVSELARKLRVNPQELRDLLPRLGVSIGEKAIKIDNRTADRVASEWPNFMRKINDEKFKKAREKKEELLLGQANKKIAISKYTTVKEFASLAVLPVNIVLKELMKNGVFTSMNEKIDFDTAAVIGADLGLEVTLSEEKNSNDNEDSKNTLSKILEKEDKAKMAKRPPVIVVMGHVDHGKTKLLDSIRRTNVVAQEAGGITQHIGAYQVERRNRLITFIDTPGHEAFTAMRSRGAKVADVAILVVAADDGVKPQTVEAYRIIEAAKLPFIVAINKIDKPTADINKTKQELATQLNITSEDWGGKIVCAPVSAINGTGVIELLDMILLTADLNEEGMKANIEAPAAGTIIESHVNKGAGPVATILIQNGTLRKGDELTFNNTFYGKVRALKNYKEEDIETALPSQPARIIGLKILPEVGDILEVGKGEKIKIKKIKTRAHADSMTHSGNDESDNIPKLNIIIKSDFLGSTEAIEESLEKINTDKVKVKIIHKGLGNITEGDIQKAETSGAQICGFHIKIPANLEIQIREKGIYAKNFDIIYDLIDHVKSEMQKLVIAEITRVDLGRLKVLAIFRTEANSQIIGGKVIDGTIESGSFIEVTRNKEIMQTGKLAKLQSGKQDVSRIETNQECGLQYEGRPIIQVGDILNFYKEDKKISKLQ